MKSHKTAMEAPTEPVPSPAMPSPSSATAGALSSSITAKTNPDFWNLVHRALRGRYPLVISLALLGGTLGAIAGWILAARVYRSEGMVRIASSVPRVMQETDQNKPIEMYDAFLQAQQALIGSRKLIDVALQDPAWQKSQPLGQSRTPEQFGAALKVEVRPRNDCLRIFFSDTEPTVAAAGVRAMINAYQGVYQREQDEFERQRLELLEQRQSALEESVRRCEIELGTAEASPTHAEPVRLLSADEIAMRDAVMRRYLDEQLQHEDDIAVARLSYGEAHPAMVRLRIALDRARRKVARYVEQYHTYSPTVVRRDNELTVADPARQRWMQQSADDARKELADVTRRIDVLKTEGAVAGRLTVVTAGDVPLAPDQTSAKKMAALGGLAGGGLPVVLLTLLGLAYRRYDRATHAADDFAEVVPFFAILPALRAKPNEDYAAAAHAVHRIRIKLQPREQGKTVSYLLTSASRGEGKTSAAAGLALSFAAAGCRTLLIDADFDARMLTRAFHAEQAPGLTEALAAGGALRDVKWTRAGLAVLPAGQTQNFHMGTLSGAALRQLLVKARESFDVILIDAGCVMESPEALTIAGQVDGVLCTIARGQAPSRVQRALRELQAVGAPMAGMLFNRTDMREFYAAVNASPATLPRASASATTPDASRFGAIVTAVLHSIQLTRADDVELFSSPVPRLARSDATETTDRTEARNLPPTGTVAA